MPMIPGSVIESINQQHEDFKKAASTEIESLKNSLFLFGTFFGEITQQHQTQKIVCHSMIQAENCAICRLEHYLKTGEVK